eukprot:151567-Heterocapsa_arctica.AAC.1
MLGAGVAVEVCLLRCVEVLLGAAGDVASTMHGGVLFEADVPRNSHLINECGVNEGPVALSRRGCRGRCDVA